MDAEHPAKWKTDCLRFALAPLKAYAGGIPLVVLVWWTSFQEANPHGWENSAARWIYPSVLASIFADVGKGYLLCLGGLVLGIAFGCWIGDVNGVRSALWFLGLVLLCLLVLLPVTFRAPTR
jgi:hypothetical protein